MKITITLDLDPAYADPGHPMGITEEGYDQLNDALSALGTDIEVQQA